MKTYGKTGLLVAVVSECIKRKKSLKIAQRFLRIRYHIKVDASVLEKSKDELSQCTPPSENGAAK